MFFKQEKKREKLKEHWAMLEGNRDAALRDPR